MSHKADIDDLFNRLCEKIPEKVGEIRTAHFEVFEALEWDESAKEVVEYMLNNSLEQFVDGNMRCYLINI